MFWADLRKCFSKNRSWGSFIDTETIFFENQLNFGKFGAFQKIRSKTGATFSRRCGEIFGQLSGLLGNCRAIVGTVRQLSGAVGQLSGAVVRLSRASRVLASPHPAAPTGALRSKSAFLSIFVATRLDWNADQIQDSSQFSQKSCMSSVLREKWQKSAKSFFCCLFQ